jgi:hypothetical protein
MLLGLAAIVAGLALLVSVVGAVSQDDRGPRLDAAVAPAPRPARRERVAIPVRIEIPSTAVRAPIIRLGLNSDRTLEVPRIRSLRARRARCGLPRPAGNALRPLRHPATFGGVKIVIATDDLDNARAALDLTRGRVDVQGACRACYHPARGE